MTPNEFYQIYQFSRIKTYSKDQTLTIQDMPISHLLIIKTGHADVIKNNEVCAQLGPNLFVGEMSFLTGGNANATVMTTTNKIECICWDKSEINKLEKFDADLYVKLKQAIAINLIKKIDKNQKTEVIINHI